MQPIPNNSAIVVEPGQASTLTKGGRATFFMRATYVFSFTKKYLCCSLWK